MSGTIICVMRHIKNTHILLDTPYVKTSMSTNFHDTYDRYLNVDTSVTVTSSKTINVVDTLKTIKNIDTSSTVDIVRTAGTFQVQNPYFVAGSGVEYNSIAEGANISTTSFPTVVNITPAVSSAEAMAGASSAAAAAAITASVLPILALGGSVAFATALMNDAYRSLVESKRRAVLLEEFKEIAADIDLRATLHLAEEYGKFPEMQDIALKLSELETGMKELASSTPDNASIIDLAENLLWAREINGNFSSLERDLAYLKFRKAAELDARAEAVAMAKKALISTIRQLPSDSIQAGDLAGKAEKIFISRPVSSEIGIAGTQALARYDEELTKAETALESLGNDVFSLCEISSIPATSHGEGTVGRHIRGQNKIDGKAQETDIIERVDKLLASLSSIKDCREYPEVLKKFDGIRNETDAERRAMLYDDFVIFCEELLTREYGRILPRRDLFEIKNQLECLGTKGAAGLAAELEAAAAAGGPIDMDSLKKKINDIVWNDSGLLESEMCLSALRSAFEELGYEADDNFETTLITDKKACVHKPSMKCHHIQILSNPDKNLLQIEVVRETESASPGETISETEALRDTEVQAEFCGDYSKIVDSLKSAGIEFEEKLRKEPGEAKPRKVSGIRPPQSKSGDANRISKENA